jgi:hypothetical protein
VRPRAGTELGNHPRGSLFGRKAVQWRAECSGSTAGSSCLPLSRATRSGRRHGPVPPLARLHPGRRPSGGHRCGRGHRGRTRDAVLVRRQTDLVQSESLLDQRDGYTGVSPPRRVSRPHPFTTRPHGRSAR